MKKRFNPFLGGLDFVGKQNQGSPESFSYKTISDDESVTIPENQQMLVDGHLRVLGHLQVNGDLIDLSARKPESFLYDLIDDSESVVVHPNRLLIYKGHIRINGHLRVLGRLETA